jgi:hypothetical protein
MALDERTGAEPLLDLGALVSAPTVPAPAPSPVPPPSGRPGKVRIKTRPDEPEQDEPDLLAPASLRGWAVSAATHILILVALALIVLKPPPKPPNEIDTTLAGEAAGSQLGEDLTGALGIDEPLAMPELTPEFTPPAPALAASSIAPPKLKSGQQGPALTGTGQAGSGEGFGVAKFGHGGERINNVDVKVGNPQFTLIWDSTADLDLHVLEPGGSHLYWESRRGVRGGELDVDDIDGFGPENVYWGGGLDKGNGPPGAYKWFVHYYGSIGGIIQPTRWKVRVKLNGAYTIYEGKLNRIDQRSRTYTVEVDPDAGSAEPPATGEAVEEPAAELATKAKPPATGTSRPSEPPPGPQRDAQGWVILEPEGAGFHAVMPEEPLIDRQLLPTASAGEQEIHTFKVDRGEGGYIVAYNELPPGATASGATRLLDESARGMVERLGGTLLASRPVAAAGVPGRALEFEVPDRIVAGGGMARARIFLDGNTFYSVSVTGTKEFVARRDTDKFLDSFRPTTR